MSGKKSAMRIAYFSAVAAAALCAAPVLADTLPVLPSAPIVSDAALSQIRGMYVPPARQAPVPVATITSAMGSPVLANAQSAAFARTAAVNPLSGLGSGAGTVTYFGVEMVSTWTQTSTTGTQGVSAGVDLGFNLAQGGVSIAKWTSSTNGGLPTTAPAGSIDGSETGSVSNGVGQNIQVAGNGNTISNTAAVIVNGSDSGFVVPTTNTCGVQCSISIGSNAATVEISTPQGNVLQTIGPNGILQSAQVASDMNTVTNQLGVHVQTSGSPSFNAGSLLPIIQSLNGLP